MNSFILVLMFLAMTLVPISSDMEARHSADDTTKEAAQFSLERPKVTLHEPVVLVIEIKNSTGTDIQFDLGQDRKANFLFALALPSGEKIALPRLKKGGLSRVGTIRLKTGETYSQRLVLNEWYDFEGVGRYELQARLAKPIKGEDGRIVGGEEPFHGTLEIEARNEPALARLFDSIAYRIEASNSYEDASEAALELSYARDAIAVPYLERVLKARKLVEPIAISGLERIGNNEAVRALSSAMQIKDNNAGVLARAALQRLEDSTPDPSIRQQIMNALKPDSNPNT